MKKYEAEPVGNAAKMREALKEFVEYSNLVCRMGMFNRDRLVSITKKASDAIAAPPRNCDIGTPDEHLVRHRKWCWEHDCKHTDSCKLCVARWAQMPYEEGGTNTSRPRPSTGCSQRY